MQLYVHAHTYTYVKKCEAMLYVCIFVGIYVYAHMSIACEYASMHVYICTYISVICLCVRVSFVYYTASNNGKEQFFPLFTNFIAALHVCAVKPHLAATSLIRPEAMSCRSQT